MKYIYKNDIERPTKNMLSWFYQLKTTRLKDVAPTFMQGNPLGILIF